MPVLACLPSFVRRRHVDKVASMKAPQQLSREAIEKFKAIYKKEFGESISDDEAQEMGLRLLNFLRILLEPSSNTNTVHK